MTDEPKCRRCSGPHGMHDTPNECIRSLADRLAALEPKQAPAVAEVPRLAEGWSRLTTPGMHPPGLACPPNCTRECICYTCDAFAVYARPSDDTGACEIHALEMGVFAPPRPAAQVPVAADGGPCCKFWCGEIQAPRGHGVSAWGYVRNGVYRDGCTAECAKAGRPLKAGSTSAPEEVAVSPCNPAEDNVCEELHDCPPASAGEVAAVVSHDEAFGALTVLLAGKTSNEDDRLKSLVGRYIRERRAASDVRTQFGGTAVQNACDECQDELYKLRAELAALRADYYALQTARNEAERELAALRTAAAPGDAVRAEAMPVDLTKTLLQVVREFIADCDHDIEGCDSDELTHIDGAMCAAETIRRRFVNLVTGVPCDERGEELASASFAEKGEN